MSTQIVEENDDMVRLVPQECAEEMDIAVPPMIEEIVEVVLVTPHELDQENFDESRRRFSFCLRSAFMNVLRFF